MLVDADMEAGGALLRENATINGMRHVEWVSARPLATLGAAPDTQVLMATTASVSMDQNGVLLAQRLGAHLPIDERRGSPEQRLWHVRARHIVHATGALERPIVFQDNDRPGIMLASGARSYLHRLRACCRSEGSSLRPTTTRIAPHSTGMPLAFRLLASWTSGPRDAVHCVSARGGRRDSCAVTNRWSREAIGRRPGTARSRSRSNTWRDARDRRPTCSPCLAAGSPTSICTYSSAAPPRTTPGWEQPYRQRRSRGNRSSGRRGAKCRSPAV